MAYYVECRAVNAWAVVLRNDGLDCLKVCITDRVWTELIKTTKGVG